MHHVQRQDPCSMTVLRAGTGLDEVEEALSLTAGLCEYCGGRNEAARSLASGSVVGMRPPGQRHLRAIGR